MADKIEELKKKYNDKKYVDKMIDYMATDLVDFYYDKRESIMIKKS